LRVFIDSNTILSAVLFPDGEVSKVLFHLLKTHLASAILSDADILLTGDKDFSVVKVKKPLIFCSGKYLQLINKAK
jgi:predicted nucleic acid-binding protein